VPFAREYGGLLDNRSFGGAQVARTFYARGQTGQQLLLGAYQALARQIHLGSVTLYNRMDMLDVVLHEGRAVGITARDLLTGEVTSHSAHAVLLATGGYSNVYFLSTNAKACNVTATWRAHRKGAAFANPCFTQIHPTCIPPADEFQSKLTLMSESLRNDGRIWVPTSLDETRAAGDIPEDERDYYLERKYPAFGNLVPRDVASRNAKTVVDEGRGVGPLKNGVYLDFADAIGRFGEDVIRERYGNLFDMYERITGEDPYEVPMRIYPATHYTMGGLWVDYNLQTTIPGLFALGEANFSDHGANRLGASALMQGLADGYFVAPTTVAGYLAQWLGTSPVPTDHECFTTSKVEVEDRIQRLVSVKGTQSVDHYHRELGKIIWDYCGMSRNKAGLEKALTEIPAIREQFWSDVKVLGDPNGWNQSLEKALRVADFMEMAELKVFDALHREESCGGHFREEHQTEEGEAQRDDEHFAYVAAWEWGGQNVQSDTTLHKEPLVFDNVELTQRSYK
jgi:succinate dehydrogenase / fumarate reductase flavoprotein subunit